MRNKLKLYIITALCCMIILLTYGCKAQNENKNNIPLMSDEAAIMDITPTVPTITADVTQAVPSIAADNEQLFEDGASDKRMEVIFNEELDDLSQFKLMKNCFLDYQFLSGNQGSIEGSYDLNMDGKLDNISLNIYGRPATSKSSITVNDITLEFDLFQIYEKEVCLIDLDKSDNYIEIACKDDGPSADEIYIFFRYDGEQLIELGSIDNYAFINEKGKLISSFHLSNQFTPAFCSAWYEIKDNTFVVKVNAVDKYLNKSYDFSGGDAFFIPFDEVPEKITLDWEITRHFEPEKVKILDILYLNDMERTLNYYFVELSSGDKGLLYFWIGD